MQTLTRSQKTILVILGISALVVMILAALVVIQTFPSTLPEVAVITQAAQRETVSPGLVVSNAPAPTTASPTPTPQYAPLNYTVQSGDSLSTIASQFGVTVEELYIWNELDSDLIQPGWKLIVSAPGSSNSSEAQEPPITVPATTEVAEATIPTTTNQPGIEISEHWVESGETLESIAIIYQLSAADLRIANYMVGEALITGQRLIIPTGTISPAPFQFSILEGDLYATYPQTYEAEGFTLHTTPYTYPALNPERLAEMELEALQHIESLFQTNLVGHFDVFIAGSVFTPPNRTLRGRSYSLNRQTLYLHDGSGNAADQIYIATHELTHLFAWNVFGAPVSVMLSEGAAVYSGMQAISGQGHMPLDTFCAAYLKVGQLPRVSGSLSFEGHILDLQNYYAAGCFVGHLIETYSPQSFGLLYPSGNFESVYGKSTSELETEWRDILAMEPVPTGLSPERLVNSVARLEGIYLDFFSGFSGTASQMEAYRELDLARLALLSGDLDGFDEQLILYEAALQVQ